MTPISKILSSSIVPVPVPFMLVNLQTQEAKALHKNVATYSDLKLEVFDDVISNNFSIL
jgi:hypothetical protein